MKKQWKNSESRWNINGKQRKAMKQQWTSEEKLWKAMNTYEKSMENKQFGWKSMSIEETQVKNTENQLDDMEKLWGSNETGMIS